MKITFIGTPEFGAIILEGLIKNGHKPVLVIAETDKPVGRDLIITPPPAKVIAQKYGIPVLQPEKIIYALPQLLDAKPDLIVVAAYGQIIPKEILDIPKEGCLNVHPSLLPKYRGPSPIQYPILRGEKETGATIMLMDEKMDSGPIIIQRAIEIEENETSATLHDKLADLGLHLLIEAIIKWPKGLLRPTPQDETKATYTKILSKDDGKLIWKKNAEELEKEIKAFSSWPGSFTFWPKFDKLLRIKVLKARFSKSPRGIPYGAGKTLMTPQNEIAVQCGKGIFPGSGDLLVIEKIQLEGKREMTSEDFLRGHPDFMGTVLK